MNHHGSVTLVSLVIVARLWVWWATASNRLARANRASHGPSVIVKERVRRVRENQKEHPKVPKVQRFVQGQNLENWSVGS